MGDLNLLEATRAVFASGLASNEKLVALALLNHWSKSRETFPGVGRLVLWTSLSRRSVLRSVQLLEALGALKVERKAGLANRYNLAPLSALTSATQAPVPEGHQCHTGNGPVPQGHGSGATQALDQCHTGTRSDPGSDPSKRSRKGSMPSDESEVFAYWASTLWSKISKREPKPTDGRMKPIRARLSNGYSVSDLKVVIDKVALSAWHLGENDRGRPYIEPKTILRNEETVDTWLAQKRPQGPRRLPVQQGASETEVQSWGQEGARALGIE